MKIKSNLIFNTHLNAQHKGKGVPERLAIPAGATIELADKEWKKYAKAAEGLINSENLELVKAPALSKEEQEAANKAAVAEAEATLAKLKPAVDEDDLDADEDESEVGEDEPEVGEGTSALQSLLKKES